MSIGVIADDVTGGTDVAVAFRRSGLRVLLLFETPSPALLTGDVDVCVIALKTRTAPPGAAISASLEALRWLKAAGAERFYFKYCSTFDSTPNGNIGPVLDALADALDTDLVVSTPSSPQHARTQYGGCLFVDGMLLSETHMRNHPLTPMNDPYLPRVLQEQTRTPVSLIDHATVAGGPDVVRAALADPGADGRRFVLADAIDADDLRTLGDAVSGHRLVAGAAGLAGALAAHIATRNVSHPDDSGDPVGDVPAVVLAGSCSARTLAQVDQLLAAGHPAYFLDVLANPDPATLADGALAWYDRQQHPAPLIYSSTPPDRLATIQRVLGVAESSRILEEATGSTARGLRRHGVRRFVVAGGETSGAVVRHLSVSGGRVGAELAPGVPWIYAVDTESVALLLKSGNFGEPDLLVRASGAAGSSSGAIL